MKIFTLLCTAYLSTSQALIAQKIKQGRNIHGVVRSAQTLEPVEHKRISIRPCSCDDEREKHTYDGHFIIELPPECTQICVGGKKHERLLVNLNQAKEVSIFLTERAYILDPKEIIDYELNTLYPEFLRKRGMSHIERYSMRLEFEQAQFIEHMGFIPPCTCGRREEKE